MIKIFNTIKELEKALAVAKVKKDVDSVLKLDLPFYDYNDKVPLLFFPVYIEGGRCLIFILKKEVFVHAPFNFNEYERVYREILKKSYGESTVITFLVLKNVLKNYSEQFQKIRNKMNELDIKPVLDEIEESGRELRRLTDKMESLVEFLIVLKQRETKQFNIDLISFDYDVLATEARYWLERCRSHIYRIASLRTKSEMQSNRELNDTMHRLTVIITFLTIVSIVVSVPGTIGAIFGIPALSEAYFQNYIGILVLVLIGVTFISILLGWVYWKSLNLKKR